MQLSVKEVATLLQVSEKTIYRWIKEGTIPGYKVNEQYRFHRAEILEWATANKIRVSADILDEGSVHVPSLREALKAGGIVYRLGGSNKEQVLRSMVEALPMPEEVDREMLFRVLAAREAMASTGVGEGVAIPHVRNPIVLHVPRPVVTLCFLEKPVDFGALDGQPVHCLFGLVSPTVRAHLQLLSRLAFALSDPGFKAALRAQALREELFAHVTRVEDGLEKKDHGRREGEA